MSEVYRAEDVLLSQPRALKFLSESAEKISANRERLLGEARTALRITHPNVCRVYDIVELSGRWFLPMELIDGEDLRARLRRRGGLCSAEAVELGAQLARGLHAIHAAGILHHDIKPANVMIDQAGQVRITDLGLAGLVDDPGTAQLGAGTWPYMAPERFRGEDSRVQSDLYSLGLVLYEMLIGWLPSTRWLGGTSPSSPRRICKDIRPAVARVTLRCLEEDPARRPASAQEVVEILKPRA